MPYIWFLVNNALVFFICLLSSGKGTTILRHFISPVCSDKALLTRHTVKLFL